MEADVERVLELVEAEGWQDLDLTPVPPDPGWRPDTSELTPGDEQLLADVAEHGWHHVHVHPREGNPMWSFSVGLFRTWGQPDVLLSGLEMDTCHDLMNTAADAARAGRGCAPGDRSDDFVEGYEVAFLAVRPDWYASFLGYAQWFHGSSAGFPVLQLVWPDRDGRFPWEPGCTLDPAAQPLLGPAP